MFSSSLATLKVTSTGSSRPKSISAATDGSRLSRRICSRLTVAPSIALQSLLSPSTVIVAVAASKAITSPGSWLGATVDAAVGATVGAAVGATVGAAVGAAVGVGVPAQAATTRTAAASVVSSLVRTVSISTSPYRAASFGPAGRRGALVLGL